MILQIGVKVLLQNSSNELLLLKRSEKYLSNNLEAWDIPGGRIEPEENLRDALVREVKEETNINLIGSPKLLQAQDIFVPHKDLHVVRLTYSHNIGTNSVIILSEEHDEYQWVAIEEAKTIGVEPFLKDVLDTITVL